MATEHEALQMGWKRHQARDYRGAEAIYRRVLEYQPNSADAWCFLGILHYDQGRYEESVAAYEQALRLRPEFPVASSNLSNSLSALNRLDEAERSVRRALELKPDYITAWTNLGAILVKQGRFEESAEVFERTLELSPNNEAAHRNLGAVLIRQGRLEEGSQHSDAALRINPRSAEAHRNRAIVRLLMGDFEAGWEEYEWRWHCPDQRMPPFVQPLWQGEPLGGRTLLLHAEQGLGDTLHFVRYARLARERGARVVVDCQAALVPLLQSCPYIDILVPRGTPLPPFDVHLPLMSAPRVFQTRLDTIPADIPYLFARPERVAYWREQLERYPRPRVGIAWQGSRNHQADRQRSIELARLEPLNIAGVILISLQRGEGVEQIAAARHVLPVVDLGPDVDRAFGAFIDTAAILMNLDLVITVDTAVAHLAGALGVPVWTLLSFSPDWRWLLEREDSPWYPTMRLLRQQKPGDWSAPLEQARAGLERLVAAASSPVATTPPAPAIAALLDKLSQLESAGDFGPEFIRLSRELVQQLRSGS